MYCYVYIVKLLEEMGMYAVVGCIQGMAYFGISVLLYSMLVVESMYACLEGTVSAKG